LVNPNVWSIFRVGIQNSRIGDMDISPQLAFGSPFHGLDGSLCGVGAAFSGIRGFSRHSDGLLHMIGMLLRSAPQTVRRTPQSERECGEREGFKNQPRIMMALSRIYDRPEDDPDYTSKVVAGVLLLIGFIAVIITCVRMDRIVGQFGPPKRRDQNASDADNQ